MKRVKSHRLVSRYHQTRQNYEKSEGGEIYPLQFVKKRGLKMALGILLPLFLIISTFLEKIPLFFIVFARRKAFFQLVLVLVLSPLLATNISP
jgi:hypothetical protein